ncbi:ABC transporter permease [Desulfolithobacter sp.]
MLRRIVALMIKEFLTVLKDRQSRMVIIVPPIAQLIIFGYAASFDLNHVSYAVYNEDRGLEARRLLSHFHGSEVFELYTTVESDGEVAPLIDTRKVLMVLHVPPDFSARLHSGKPARLQVIIDGRNSNTAMIALGYVQNIVSTFSTSWISNHGGHKPPAVLVQRAWFNATLDSSWFIIVGIVALLNLVVTLEVTALSVAREREAGTFDQLLVTPMTPFEILVGKSLPGMIIGVIEATVVITMVAFWFHVPLRGSLPALYLGLLIFLLSAVGIGLMISSLSVTQQQGLMGAFLFLVPAVILSGFATPIENMPELVQYLTYLNPMRYFLIIVRSVFLQGASFDLLWPQYWPMAVIGIMTLTTAALMFRKRMY